MKTNFNTTNWRYIFNSRRLLVYAIASAGTAVVIILLAILPQIQSAFDLFSELQKEQKRTAQLRQKVLQLEQAPQSLVLSQSGLINQALPSKKPLLELLTSMSLVAGQTQVRITDISLSPGQIATEGAQNSAESRRKVESSNKKKTSSRNPYEELEVELTISGGLDNINQFLENVEKMAPFTTVVDMTLNEEFKRATDTRTESAFIAEMRVTTYFYSQSIVATLDAPLPEMNTEQSQVLQELNSYTLPQLELQQTIQGGGLQDLFGINNLEDLEN